MSSLAASSDQRMGCDHCRGMCVSVVMFTSGDKHICYLFEMLQVLFYVATFGVHTQFGFCQMQRVVCGTGSVGVRVSGYSCFFVFLEFIIFSVQRWLPAAFIANPFCVFFPFFSS